MYINFLRFSPQSTQSMNVFFTDICAACRFKSAFICVYPRFQIAKTLFIDLPSARINRFHFRRASTHWISGASRCCGRSTGAAIQAGWRTVCGFHDSCFGNMCARTGGILISICTYLSLCTILLKYIYTVLMSLTY